MFDFFKINDYRKFSIYAVPLVLLLAVEFFIYQAYFFIPVTVEGNNLVARKGTTSWAFLKSIDDPPQYGNLLDIEGKILKKGKGEPPLVWINGKNSSFDYKLKRGDRISVKDGMDVTEPLVKQQVFIEKPVENYGTGSFIIIERKGKLGVKEVKAGKYSKKIASERIISKPIPTGISRINIRNKKVVALTFDDGPSEHTPQIMRILKIFKIRATFFVLGRNCRRYPNYLYRIKKNNHVIGNHTYNHISMQTSSASEIRRELKLTDHVIYNIAKVKTKWVRPPGGALRQAVVNFVVMGGKNISMWNTDTIDWKKPSPDLIVKRVVDDLKPGNVILMHDGGGDRTSTVLALPKLIRELKKRGYRFVTLDQLYSTIRPYD